MTRVKRCDELWSKVVKVQANYKCERCGNSEGRLNSHHIIARTNYKLRYDVYNGVCLCFNCHINFAHADPKGWHDWLMTHRERDYDYVNREKIGKYKNNYTEIEDKLKGML